MRGIPTPSSDCSSASAPTSPYRPRPKNGGRSPAQQRKSHVPDVASSNVWLCSLRPIARIVVVVATFICMIATSTLLESSAGAQTAPRSESIDRFAEFIDEASGRFAVPARWIRAVMKVESGGDAHAISSCGAVGLMQLMPGTWVELSVRHGLGLDPFDPRDNILAGTAYLKEMHDRFGSAGVLAAYHAGPARYEQHLATDQPLPPATIAYVTAVTPLVGDRQPEQVTSRTKRPVPWREAPLFVERADAR
jgi:soluble lytic murein transglycosylase-like protein